MIWQKKICMGWMLVMLCVGNPALYAQSGNAGDDKVHVVQAGETLYAISRKYKVTVEQIQSWNDMSGTSLSVGQKLVIKGKEVGGTNAPVQEESPSVQPEWHTVAKGETLYAISKKYGLSVADLRTWNRLAEVTLSPGQRLRLRRPGAAIPDEESTTPVHSDSPLAEALAEGEEQDGSTDSMSAVEADSLPSETPDEQPVNSNPELTILTVDVPVAAPEGARVEEYEDKLNGGKYLKVEESGRIDVIGSSEVDPARFYVLHKTLPKGSYLRVDNPANGQSILAEVAGKLPEGDSNLLRMTARCRNHLRLQPGAQARIRYMIKAK